MLTTVLALLLGWLAGMLTGKRAEHWCPVDGSQLKCIQCAKAGLHLMNGQDNAKGRPT
jgi:hypothetical protein